MPSLILACPSCNQRYDYRFDNDIPTRITCPRCGQEKSCDDYSALLFCPKCYSKLEAPLICRNEEIHCPRCNTVVPFGTDFTFGELDENHHEEIIVAQQNTPHWLLDPEVLFDKYRIIKPIGQGGMAEVYLAEHILLHQNCALKIMKPAFFTDNPVLVKRFLREAKLAYNLNSPNIVRVFDAGTDGETGYLFLAMDYVDGKTLTNILLDKGRFTEKDMRFIAQQVAQALVVLAENKIVHRDIKPSNIIRSITGEIKLADLGIARLESSDATLTMTQAAIGTPAYASPEQCTDAHQTDARSDIYSLGATLYHLATGIPPFSGKSPVEIMLNVIKKKPEPLSKKRPDLSPNFVLLIEHMMAKDPNKRPQNAEDLLQKINALDQVPENHHGNGNASRLNLDRMVKAREEAKAKNEAEMQARIRQTQSTATRVFHILFILLSTILAFLIVACIIRFSGINGKSKRPNSQMKQPLNPAPKSAPGTP